MHPTNDAKSARFSLASQQAICRTLSPAILQSSSCLKGNLMIIIMITTIITIIKLDPGTRKTLSGNVCGNGIKEGSEECDCGPADSDSCSNDPCCNGSTCKLKAGAKCSDKNDLCCSGCKVKPAQTVCRPSIGMCDVEEKCNGSNGDCPPDAFIEDLTECTISGILLNGQQGQCAQGYCTSRTLQCQARSNEVGTYDGECRGFANNCELSCSVKGQQGRCDRIFGGFFVDGTACGYKGVCKSGACEQYGINALIGWIMANLGISITIFVVIFLMIIFCIHRCYKIFHVNRNIRQLNTSRSELIGSQPNLAASNASLRRAESAVSISRPQPALSRSSTVASNLFKSVNEGQVTPIMMKKASYPGQRSSTFAPMSASTAVPPPTAPQPTAQSTVSAPPPYGNTTDSSNTQKWVDPKLYNGNAELEGAKLDEFIKSTSKDSDINK